MMQDMKLGTPEILKNLHFPDGTPVIPSGSLVYISTDDPGEELSVDLCCHVL
jgi:hypothetical protein